MVPDPLGRIDKMRATLTYSVPFLEVPGEASRMASEAARRLDFSHKETAKIVLSLLPNEVPDDQIQTALDALESVRIVLSDIDSRLADCHGVLIGFLRAKHANEHVVGAED